MGNCVSSNLRERAVGDDRGGGGEGSVKNKGIFKVPRHTY